MLTKNALGNMHNRYSAVLKKCRLLNIFGSLSLVTMLSLGGLVGNAWAADLVVSSDQFINGKSQTYNTVDIETFKVFALTGNSNYTATGATTIGEDSFITVS